MGFSWKDADDWDFVAYSATLSEWNARQQDQSGEDAIIESEPPPIEWMIADDQRAHERGHKVF